ncbi:MAG: CRISPR-associated endonuclease Cas1, partial [Chloroflexota bacterium]|nr:CRISPR-associated endonuclease Cas1 [Chloroflexota bacterium]
TTPAIAYLLERGIALVFLNSHGQLRGRLVGAAARNLELRHRQYRCAEDPAFCLAVSRAIVRGKLENYGVLTRRMRRGRDDQCAAAVAEIEKQMTAAPGALDLDSLRGIEGAGTKAYFDVLRGGLQHELGFVKRVRRPPTDPVNALLSLGYTLLGENLFAALEIVGLDPYDGFYHADKYGRPALALDLIEEFRGVIVDSLVRQVINREIIGAGDFQKASGTEHGVFLNRNGLRKFFHHYNARLNTRVQHPVYRKKWTYLECFEVQARLMRKTIEGELAAYVPFRTK